MNCSIEPMLCGPKPIQQMALFFNSIEASLKARANSVVEFIWFGFLCRLFGFRVSSIAFYSSLLFCSCLTVRQFVAISYLFFLGSGWLIKIRIMSHFAWNLRVALDVLDAFGIVTFRWFEHSVPRTSVAAPLLVLPNWKIRRHIPALWWWWQARVDPNFFFLCLSRSIAMFALRTASAKAVLPATRVASRRCVSSAASRSGK